MISQEEYNARLAQLLESGVDARIAPTRAVLEYGLQNNNITQEEADYVISTLKSFIMKHPGYVFLTPQEKHQCNGPRKMRKLCPSEKMVSHPVKPAMAGFFYSCALAAIRMEC